MDVDKKPVELLDELTHLISALDQLNALLKLDRQSFSDNNTKALTESDAQKQRYLEKISKHLITLQMAFPSTRQNVIQALRDHTKQLHHSQQSKVETMIQSLQGKLTEGYEALITNSHIVTMNLRYFDNLWNKLLALAPDKQGSYEKPAAQPK